MKIIIAKVTKTHLAWIILTLVFMLGWDQLYAIEPATPLSQREPFFQYQTKDHKLKKKKKIKYQQILCTKEKKTQIKIPIF